MKKLIRLSTMTYLIVWLGSSCSTVRKKVKSSEQKRFKYAQRMFVSDSAVRQWYFYSDSAFSYHPDSGLSTLSGRLLGWELSVNHKLEQKTVDSMGEWSYDEHEAMREGDKSRWMGYAVRMFIAVIVIGAFWMAKK